MVSGRHRDTDIVIVGGGPSGSAAAIWAALHGISVTLVESKSFPRNEVGETLHPGCSIIFEKLGVEGGINAISEIRPTGIHVRHRKIQTFRPYGSDERGTWRGYQLLRSELDCILLERAKHLGVKIIQPGVALKPILTEGRVAGVITSSGNLPANFVIDAAGATHWLQRHLNLEIDIFSPKLISEYGYLKIPNIENLQDHPLFDVHEFGWTWTSHVKGDVLHWTTVRKFSDSKNLPLPPDSYSDFELIGRVKAKDVTWRKITRCAGEGYFIVGDGAAVMDPSVGKGIFRGLYSGVMAAHFIILCSQRLMKEDEAKINFTTMMSSWYHSDVQQIKNLYSQFDLSELVR